MNKKSQILIDIDGIVSYPNLGKVVLEPLKNKGADMMFYTFMSSAQGIDQLQTYNLDQYISRGYGMKDLDLSADTLKLIAGHDSAYLKQVYDIPDEWILNAKRKNHVKRFMSYFQVTDYTVNEYSVLMQKWASETFNGKKFPPLLGKNNYLFIESDNAFSNTDRDERDLSQTKKWALENDYSLILVPEHPYAFKDSSLKIVPQDILHELHKITTSWTGEQLVIDLGEKLGIYQEGTLRHPERF